MENKKQIRKDEISAERINGLPDLRIYELSEVVRKNGTWYLYEVTIPGISYHSFKFYRNKEQAVSKYNYSLALEDWRNERINNPLVEMPKYI